MSRIKHIVCSIVLLLFASGAWAQTKAAYMKAASDANTAKDHHSALVYYLEALEFDTTDLQVIYNIAESARQFHSIRIARDRYEEILDKDNEDTFPMAAYWAAAMAQLQGDYQGAKDKYNLYLSEHEGEDPYYSAKAQKEISSCDWAINLLNSPGENITITNYDSLVNTPYTEFGAIGEDSGISYSSLRFDPEERGYMPTDMISKVLNSDDDPIDPEGRWSSINRANLHTAHTAYNFNRSKVYYTICTNVNKSDIRCDLYSREITPDGSFGPEFKLPDNINQEGVTSTQPNIGFDKSNGVEVLYFVSDREGGEGKLDIWSSVISGPDEYDDPVNLTAINTAEDDITPFFHNNTQVLYFSSNGYTSLGGYDIYQTSEDQGTYATAQNLGAPINSSYHDLYYTLSELGDKGFFSSNRPGSQFIDEINESCCYDIFQFDVGDLDIALNAITFDSKTLDSLDGATVQIVDSRTGNQVGFITNTLGADHVFTLETGNNYLIIASKPDYNTDTSTLSTVGMFRSQEIVRRIYLERNSIDLQVLTFDQITKDPLPGTTVTLRDLTDNSIQPISLTNLNGNDTYFDVVPDHRYQILATRDKYYDEVAEFVATADDGSDMIIQRLYLDRRDLDFYLPLSLYFDNDRPGQKSMRLTTDKTYSETFDEYVVKEFEFIEQYTSDLPEENIELAEQRVKDFFENDVRGGYNMVERFLGGMLAQLESGKNFELSIRGFASPRADSRYNLALSQRRVISIQNELRSYLGGALVPYIQNGQLKITELSYGENLAPTDVSDALFDRRNSIFSPEASRERRVEIVEIKSNDQGN